MSGEVVVKSAKTVWGKYKIPVLPIDEEKRIFEIILNQKSCTESEIREALSFLLSAGLQQTVENHLALRADRAVDCTQHTDGD